jgi:hypothetical protein
MVGKPGPFQIIKNGEYALGDGPLPAPRRRYDCPHYETCLNLAAALNWDNFTCRGCCGEIDQSLYWRAHQMAKKDNVVRRLCDIPTLQPHQVDSQDTVDPVEKKLA